MMETVSSNSTSRWVGAHAELVSATRGRPDGVNRVFQRSPVPMVIVDDERRYVDVNPAARLAFRLSLSELRQLRIDDLTPRSRWPLMHDAWARLVTSGCVAGFYEVASPPNTSMDIAYYAVADALPGLYLIAFAPAGWHESELAGDPGLVAGPEVTALTDRELEVLELAADGRSAPMIAAELIVSITTVRTHFAHIYEKLDVRDRAAAVAKAMRIGLIA